MEKRRQGPRDCARQSRCQGSSSTVHKAHGLALLGWARDSSGREAGDLNQNDGLKERVLSFSRGTITLKKV